MRPSIDIAKELAFYCAGTYGTIAEMEELLALAIDAARAEALEFAAGRCRVVRDKWARNELGVNEFAAGGAESAADALAVYFASRARALAQTREPA